nr:sigma-70 family RNA polymerase sigma factor [Chloroflexota bacterium]
MFDTMATTTQEKHSAEHNLAPSRNEQHILVNNIEKIVAAAQPRLARLARMQGVAPDGVEDVVQETFVEAWRHLEHLREPERFDAWLNGICRNVCLRWARSRDTAARRQAPFSTLRAGELDGSETPEQVDDLPDPLALDPAEELSRQGLTALLDRAMGYLPAGTREALTMHYLAEMPHDEVALRLGVTINALEVRLHRARRQLRQVLNNELRADAEEFGLTLDAEQETGWRETNMWCFICGRQRLLGIFEPLPGGNVNMRLRCPICSAHGCDITQTGDLIPLNLHSFRPAFKRVLQVFPRFYSQAFTTGYHPCPMCKQEAKFQGVEPHMLPEPFFQRYCIVLQ